MPEDLTWTTPNHAIEQKVHCHSFYRPQRSCGQGYVFTHVCDSVNGGVSRQGDPPGRENPRTRQTLQAGRTPLDQAVPPGKQTPEYSLRAAGTHPTGMHSCFLEIWPNMLIVPSGRSKEAPGMPPGAQILSFSCSFQQNNRLAHPLWELTPPPSPRKVLDPPLVPPHPLGWRPQNIFNFSIVDT